MVPTIIEHSPGPCSVNVDQDRKQKVANRNKQQVHGHQQIMTWHPHDILKPSTTGVVLEART